jgi:MinD-like ATPase involved in chromosome partitioning or flagellar assembly
MITVFWGARHGQGVTTTLAQVAAALAQANQKVYVVDLDPDSADLSLFQRHEDSALDHLVLDAERPNANISWPEWTTWQEQIRGITGNPRRQAPIVASKQAAEKVVDALFAADEEGAHILCDVGSSLRDLLTVRALALAHRVVVVTRVVVPDAISAQLALGYISPLLAASDRVLAALGQGGGAAEILRAAPDWRLVPVPETTQAAGLREVGQFAVPRGAGGVLTIAMPEGDRTAEGRRGARWPLRR